MRTSIAFLFGVATLVGLAATADAKVVQYRSQHPLPRKIGHGFCYIDVPHVHDFGPSDPRMYREVNGELYFVGDPAPFDYQGPRYSFYGHHPVAEAGTENGQPVYCYLNGPHYHWYQPPPQAQFQFRGGAYWYTGNYEPVYFQDRPRFGMVNDVYVSMPYQRPMVDITVMPPTFRGELLAGPGFPHGRAMLVGPGLEMGVGIRGGGPPIVEERREFYERDHRDDGRHRGWEHHEHEDRAWERHERHEHEDRGWHQGGEEHGHGWRGNPPPHAAPAAGGWRGTPAGPAHNNNHPPHGGWRGKGR